MGQREQLLADLRTLTVLIPEEADTEEAGYARERLYEFIDYHAES